ncbi:MAG TPA: ribosome maturation factor RimM [Candidatus Eisenbacteria bacterium]|nr:ribosome maturation factor RimM [Candidatus Eisenbacteria bacterium]
MPTEGPEEPILVGSIARAHGLAGEVVVDVWSEAPERFEPGRSVTARLPGGVAREVVIESARPFGERLLIRFGGITTRTQAEALRGADLTIARSMVDALPEGTHYRFELVGLRVRTREGRHLGSVADVFATGSNDVIVVRGGAREILLPYLAHVVLTVDLERGEMVVEVPPGLDE